MLKEESSIFRMQLKEEYFILRTLLTAESYIFRMMLKEESSTFKCFIVFVEFHGKNTDNVRTLIIFIAFCKM